MCDINYFKNIIIKYFNQTYYIFIIIKLHCKRIYIFFFSAWSNGIISRKIWIL